jgi:hypothetical protein
VSPNSKKENISDIIYQMDKETKALLKKEFAKTHSKLKETNMMKKIL